MLISSAGSCTQKANNYWVNTWETEITIILMRYEFVVRYLVEGLDGFYMVYIYWCVNSLSVSSRVWVEYVYFLNLSTYGHSLLTRFCSSWQILFSFTRFQKQWMLVLGKHQCSLLQEKHVVNLIFLRYHWGFWMAYLSPTFFMKNHICNGSNDK